ncbi:glycosyltransferase 87 family protein [Actinomadura hibisca]|uniref:glycosyltransferase 87 family protein n=1 Tax=Actinomadura hibisca TaxID=68565 RepID=UPI000A93AB0D|nr:glycosyltransferase 87 family protein [Actinomadura hibisca]
MRTWAAPVARAVLAVEIVAVTVFALCYDSLDFRIYMLGGQALGDGASLYTERHAGLWFTNTPFAAMLFVPLSELPLAAARVLWQLASAGAFAWACVTALRLTGRRVPPGTGICVMAAGFLLAPVYHSFFQGQVNLFLMALVLTDFHRVAQGRRAGLGIGIAAAIKLTPAVFILVLLVSRRGRDAVVAGVVFVMCTLGAFLVSPDASRVYWLHTFYDTSRVGVPYISNQSPLAIAARLLGGPDEIGGWFPLVSMVLMVCGLATAAMWARRGDWLAVVAVGGVTGLLVSPISWAHHWVWVMPVLVLLVRDGRRTVAAATYALFVLAPMWWTPHDGGPRQYGFHGLTTLVANCYLVAGLTFLAYMAAQVSFAAARASTPAVPSVPAEERPRETALPS